MEKKDYDSEWYVVKEDMYKWETDKQCYQNIQDIKLGTIFINGYVTGFMWCSVGCFGCREPKMCD